MEYRFRTMSKKCGSGTPRDRARWQRTIMNQPQVPTGWHTRSTRSAPRYFGNYGHCTESSGGSEQYKRYGNRQRVAVCQKRRTKGNIHLTFKGRRGAMVFWGKHFLSANVMVKQFLSLTWAEKNILKALWNCFSRKILMWRQLVAIENFRCAAKRKKYFLLRKNP